MSDNVTPFRRPPPRPVRPQQSGFGFKTHRGKAVLVHALVLICFALPWVFGGVAFIRIIGLAIGVAAGLIAYTSRADAMPWAMTHHEHALRTLMIGFVILTLLSLPSYVISRDWPIEVLSVISLILFWGGLIVALWAGVRSVIGLVLAIMRKPIPHPTGMLV